MSGVAIKVEDLWKEYRIGLKKSISFRESVGQWFTRDEAEYFWALRELNFDVKSGEAVGIIGKNGAGKSTLLKVLSKITYPTKGRIEINGRVSSLLEVGTGFHPELTGRQNVFLNGTILGMTQKEVQAKFDEIVAFSGVEQFIDTPVKRYSSGMKVRLAFSVAAHLEPEILIIDEVLAVGDADFQKKCLGKMEDVSVEGRTVFFVSHNMAAVEKLCKTTLVLENGEEVFSGPTHDALNYYLEDSEKLDREHSFDKIIRNNQHRLIEFEKLQFQSASFKFGQSITFDLGVRSVAINLKQTKIEIAFTIQAKDHTIVHGSNRFTGRELNFSGGQCLYSVRIENQLRPGIYSLTLFLRIKGEIQDWLKQVCVFEVLDGNPYGYANTGQIKGLILPPFEIVDK